jgi:hypothetical protein
MTKDRRRTIDPEVMAQCFTFQIFTRQSDPLARLRLTL